MKFLFDFFPIVVFFLAFKCWGIYYATGVFIGGSIIQLAIYWYWYSKVESIHVVNFLLGLFLGSATLFLHNELFIKWKPTVIYWIFALLFLGSQFIGERPLIARLLHKNLTLPHFVWNALNWSWCGFFLVMGGLNLYVVYHFDTNTWVNFKLFGSLGLTVVFIIIQGIFMSKYVNNDLQIKKE